LTVTGTTSSDDPRRDPTPRQPRHASDLAAPGRQVLRPDRPAGCSDGNGPPCTVSELRLTDLDGDIALYINGNAVVLLDVRTGEAFTVARPTRGPVNAQIELEGLYASAGDTLTFTPRASLRQRLRR
jgi:hypothetical protein